MKIIDKENELCTVVCDCEACSYKLPIESLDKETIKDALLEDGWTTKKIKGVEHHFCSSTCFSEWLEDNE